MRNIRYYFILICFAIAVSSCKKDYRCNCTQDVSGIDTTFILTGDGSTARKACDQFDSEETDHGITKTIDCQPY